MRIANSCAQDLVVRAKGTGAVAQLRQIVQEARDQDAQLFHYAAAIGDREFFGVVLSFVPLETLVEELQRPNQNGMTPIDCAKTMHPSLATDIEAFLLSRGLDSKSRPPSAQAISIPTVSPYSVPAEVEGGGRDSTLQRVVVGSSRYLACSKVASTVGETLRANGIYYAATRAVYVRHVRSDQLTELAGYGNKLLAFPESDEKFGLVWTGSKIADLAQEEHFRAAFKVYAPCTSANQQLVPGMSVLLDLENLSPTPSAEKKLILVRYLPSPGIVDTNTRTHHNVCVSDSGVRVSDKGYIDDDFLKGFRRGWYDGVYYRTVGDSPHRFLSGGNAGNPYKFNIREEDDLGYDNKRVMIKLPDEGVVFCRGVGGNPKNPEMACVLFDSKGNVRDRHGYQGNLGRWNDIFQ
ncbi:uncharacterized protein IUM83_06704 [Phytophthora cinnamomi]|uniref:uncharacterized protein n=1 Tax=Phytophthora cinnamomi TaxID=4785 RepID=UPI00355ABA8F|nr:hypothetical protein IUM83_06704 [Phytophthora cinnamomi]